jgi:hypothetical protein
MAKNTFKVAGITTHGTSSKVRFTDDLVRRVKQFGKGGASRIDLLELPSEMTKVEALQFLQAHADFQSPSDQALISDSLEDRSKVKSEVKVKTSKATKPSMDAIKARAKTAVAKTTVTEDAPF